MTRTLVGQGFHALLQGPRRWLFPVLYALALAAAPGLLRALSGRTDYYLGPGHELVSALVLVQMLALWVVAPLAGVTALAREGHIAQGSGSSAFLLGKLGAAALYCLYFMAASLPQAGLSYLLGAVDLAELLGIYATGVLMSLGLGSLGLAAAGFVRARWLATLLAILMSLLPAAAALVTAASSAPRSALTAWTSAGLAPLSSLLLHLYDIGPPGPLWLGCYGALLGWVLLALPIAAWRLRRLAVRPALE